MLDFSKFFNVFRPWRPLRDGAEPASLEETRTIVQFIQGVGKLPIDLINIEEKTEQIIDYVKCYPKSLAIQRAACHSFSNIAMELQSAETLMKKGCSDLVVQALQKFGNTDWRICWLGCSAIWNLARPEEHRYKFDCEIVDLVLNILEKYKTTCRVCNTALGALSNISLDTELKLYVGQPENIRLLLDIIECNLADQDVASTSAGLLANLAVHDEIADILVDAGCISTLTAMLNTLNRDPTFQRNCAAALSNVITSPVFIRESLECNAIEAMLDLQANAMSMGVVALMMNCFNALEIDPSYPTTTLHMCIVHGHCDLVYKKIIKSTNEGNTIDVNVVDGRGVSPLQVAVSYNDPETVALLIKCGADCEKYQYLAPGPVKTAIYMAVQKVNTIRNVYKYTLHERMKISIDIAMVIIDFLPSSDMLFAVNML